MIATLQNFRKKNESNVNLEGGGMVNFPAKLYNSIINLVLHNCLPHEEHKEGLTGKNDIQEPHEF